MQKRNIGIEFVKIKCSIANTRAINQVRCITLNQLDQRNPLSILMLEKLNATVQRGLKIDAA